MSSPAFWGVAWWVAYHAHWLCSVARAAHMTPEQQVNDVATRAIQRMKRLERRHNPLTSWDPIL